jgi:LPXTG-motif cell wall-anchored protein
MARFRISIVAALAAAVCALALAAPAGAQSYASTLSATVDNCSSVTVTGTDWRPDDPITVEIESTPTVLGTLVVDAGGDFSGTFTISKSLGDGPHVITASGPGTPPPETDIGPIPVSASVAVRLTGCAGAGTGTLPTTGSEATPWIAAGVGLILVGAVLGVITYRRRAHALHA